MKRKRLNSGFRHLKNLMKNRIWFIFCVLVFAIIGNGQNDWQTPSEKTNYRTTPSYDETVSFLQKLEKSSPLIKVSSFGKTGEGRDLWLAVAAKDKDFTPQNARKHHKAVIEIQACIHAGESDGKDAILALLRDITITKTRLNLLDNTVILFIPIYNTDGNENSSPFKRINQNGPEEMGFRANATNQNLNRDYMKADTPETRAWLNLWNTWSPDFFADCHVTDGADYQYNLTYHFEHHQTSSPFIKTWLENAFNQNIIPNTEKAGNLVAPYLEFRDAPHFEKGINGSFFTPRFSHSYVSMRNRPALLIETHMLKPYKNRVLATYDLLRFSIEEIGRDKINLFNAIKNADEDSAKLRTLPLRLELAETAKDFNFKGVEFTTEKSEISGAERVIYGNKPIQMTVPFYDETKVNLNVDLPKAYIIPPQYTEVISLLELHGIKLNRTSEKKSFEIETYKLSSPKWAPNSFESRVVLRDFKLVKINETKLFPSNSVIISLNQPLAKIAAYLLEPQSPESFVYWGFFNTIFEQKEYGEGYVLEKLAREMLAKDANLKKDFEEKLKDENFAKNPQARLNFFYERSPYFTEQKVGIYPVGRILK